MMVAVAAGLGVLNTVLMTTRDRVHDLGMFKSLGMRPGQVDDHGDLLGDGSVTAAMSASGMRSRFIFMSVPLACHADRESRPSP